MPVTRTSNSCVRALANEYESFLAAVADWARVKEQWLGEKKRAVLQQWEHVTAEQNCGRSKRRLSLQLRRMRVLPRRSSRS